MPSPIDHQDNDSMVYSKPQIDHLCAQISLADHQVDGIKRGSLSDLQFRPNASFHPIREVQFDHTQCTLTFDKPLKLIDRRLKPKEIIALIAHIRRGERELAIGQHFYLYPSEQAFGLSQTGELRIVLRNIRPRHLHTEVTQSQLSVLALLKLIEYHCPNLWHQVGKEAHKIKTLSMLQDNLTTSPTYKRLGRFIWRTAVYLIFLWLISLPIAAFGPTTLKEPLRPYYYPLFKRLTDILEPVHPVQDHQEKTPQTSPLPKSTEKQ